MCHSQFELFCDDRMYALVTFYLIDVEIQRSNFVTTKSNSDSTFGSFAYIRIRRHRFASSRHDFESCTFHFTLLVRFKIEHNDSSFLLSVALHRFVLRDIDLRPRIMILIRAHFVFVLLFRFNYNEYVL